MRESTAVFNYTNQTCRTISLGKFGSFFTAQLLGKHYDTTYQVLPDKTLSRIDTSSVLSAFELDFENPAESTATNVDFVDDSSTQALSHADIETLKEESFVTGADGQVNTLASTLFFTILQIDYPKTN